MGFEDAQTKTGGPYLVMQMFHGIGLVEFAGSSWCSIERAGQ